MWRHFLCGAEVSESTTGAELVIMWLSRFMRTCETMPAESHRLSLRAGATRISVRLLQLKWFSWPSEFPDPGRSACGVQGLRYPAAALPCAAVLTVDSLTRRDQRVDHGCPAPCAGCPSARVGAMRLAAFAIPQTAGHRLCRYRTIADEAGVDYSCITRRPGRTDRTG